MALRYVWVDLLGCWARYVHTCRLMFLGHVGLKGGVEVIKLNYVCDWKVSLEQQRVGVVIDGKILREALGWHIC